MFNVIIHDLRWDIPIFGLSIPNNNHVEIGQPKHRGYIARRPSSEIAGPCDFKLSVWLLQCGLSIESPLRFMLSTWLQIKID